MKILTTFLLTALLVGCNKSPSYDERLEGIWWSNKEMTLKKANRTKLNPKTLQFLKKSLGDLGFIYKKEKSASLSKKNPSLEIKYESYKLVKTTNNSVTIASLNGPEIQLTFEGNCYSVDTTLGLNEYFCKE